MSHQNTDFSQPPAYSGPRRGNGAGVAALVVGIVAAVVAVIPLLGMAAFFLGPVAIILGIIGLVLKNRKKGTSIAGLILGVIAMVIAGVVTASVSAGLDAVDKSLNAEHTVEYRVTTDGPANVNYWNGGGSSSKDIKKNWKKSFTTTDWGMLRVTVNADFMREKAAVGCEILLDGKSVSKNSGKGQGAMATCSGDTFSGADK
jgi:hypothetical protein